MLGTCRPREALKTKSNFIACMTSAMITLFLATSVFIIIPVHAYRMVSVIEAGTGASYNVFDTSQKHVGDTITFNLTITDVENLTAWQMGLHWNMAILGYVNLTLPSDNVFHGKSPISGQPMLLSSGLIANASVGSGQSSFTGSGTLAQLTLKITSILVPGQSVETWISIDRTGYLLDSDGNAMEGWQYNFAFFKLTNNGYFYGAISIIDAINGFGNLSYTTYQLHLNDIIALNITVTEAQDLAAWQFLLSWNTTYLSYVNTTLPSDNIFHDRNPIVPAPSFGDSGLTIGAVAGPGQPSFWGSGTIAQVFLNVESVPNLNQTVTFEIQFENIPIDTFILDESTNDVTSKCTFNNANFRFANTGSTTLLGDVNNDGTVNMKDVMILVQAFNSFPNSPRWNISYDLNHDGRIDLRDILIAVLNFGRSIN